MFGKILALLTLGSGVILSAIFNTTSPASLHPIFIIFVFLLIYVFSVGFATFFLVLIKTIILKRRNKSVIDGSGGDVVKNSYRYGSIVAFIPVVFIGMSSVGNSGVDTFILICILDAMICFYISRR